MGKKYGIFTAQYFPNLGGVEWYTFNLSKKLLEGGDKVVIIASMKKGLLEYEMMDEIPVYRLPCIELLNGRYPVVKYNKKTRSILKKMREEKFDYIIINTRFYLQSILGAMFAKKNKIPAMVIEHGSGHLSVQNRFWDTLGAGYEHFHTAVLKKICKHYYGTCEESNKWLKHFHIDSEGILYNAINLEEVNTGLALPPIYREKYGISNDAQVIAFTGRLIKEKGILQLIEAVNEIRKIKENVYLVIAGDGTLKEELEQFRDQHIIFLGRIPHLEIMRLLGESNIFCLPSDSEAFCTAVLEAVACKCYIITTERGGAKELISTKEMGMIIKNNEVSTIYKALKYALNNEEICQKAKELSYDMLVNNFTWDKTVEHLREIVTG